MFGTGVFVRQSTAFVESIISQSDTTLSCLPISTYALVCIICIFR